jgi:hypothetical protein
MDVSTKRVFLAKLLDLVAIMAECSGDFVVSRFKKDVFPLLSMLLRDFLECNAPATIPNERTSIEIVEATSPSKSSCRQASETSLIISMLRCLTGVFQQPKCGPALRDLIPTAGTLIMPFLGERDETGAACFSAIKHMVQIDSDALSRQLVHLSEGSFPPPTPWESQPPMLVCTQSASKPVTLLAQRASSLVDFINTLPEQPL